MSLGGYLTAARTVLRENIRYPAVGNQAVGFPATFNNQMLTEPTRCRWTVGGVKGIDFGAREPF
jgi:hypothetical protein